MIKPLAFIIYSWLIFIFLSCTSAYVGEKYSSLRLNELKQKINHNSSLIRSFEASGNISFDSPERSGSVWFDLKIKKPDTLFIKLEGPFGISVASALITRNGFIYYNAQENLAITGPSSDINIGAILRIRVSFDELINGLTSGFIFKINENDSNLAVIVSESYLISVTADYGTETYFIKPGDFTVSEYRRSVGQNQTEVEVNYTSYTERNVNGVNVKVPGKIVIANKPKKQTLYIDYGNIEVNNNEIQFKIKIPSSAKIIKWD